jgi:hypothetical protein
MSNQYEILHDNHYCKRDENGEYSFLHRQKKKLLYCHFVMGLFESK